MSENEKEINAALESKGLNRRQFLTRTTVGAGALAAGVAIEGVNATPAAACEQRREESKAWSFGVMCDTQWTGLTDDGYDPNTCAVEIVKELQQQFIAAGVDFVVHVGDLEDTGTTAANADTRALFAQPLYNAGIGFYPLRGNHDDSAAAAAEFTRIYPQTQTAVHNATPSDVMTGATIAAGSGSAYTTAQEIANLGGVPTNDAPTFKLGKIVGSPDTFAGGLTGLSYAVSYRNATLVLLDQFTPATNTSATAYSKDTTINYQQTWITNVLQNRTTEHAFVFAHKGLITCQHADGLLGENPAQNPAYTNAFIGSLYSNNVKLYMNGHDHMHDHSVILDTTGTNYITTVLCASNSSKFYVPYGALSGVNPQSGSNPYASNDEYYNVPAFGIRRRIPITQELNLATGTKASPTPRDVGYYIVTVDGSNVTVDYYAVTIPVAYASAAETVLTSAGTANLPGRNASYSFSQRLSFGYGLKGKQFFVASGAAYTSVKDSFGATSAKILDGTNSSTATDANGIALTKAVNTGWHEADDATQSDILVLQGMGSLVAPGGDPNRTDTYVLQLTGSKLKLGDIARGKVGLAAQNADGDWVNAVNLNTGGAAKFVSGAWKSGYGLGTYGVSGNSAWAVVNFQGSFAIAETGRDGSRNKNNKRNKHDDRW